jgi:hypothetical protein
MDDARVRRRSEALASAIYGQILITAIVAALSEDPDAETGYLLLSAVTTILIFWVAHIYARGMARGITLGRTAEQGELREFMATERPMLVAAIPTVLILALGTLGVFSRNTSVDLAISAGLGMLFLWGLLFGRYTNSSWPTALLSGALTGSLGLVIVALKAIVH